MSRMKTTLRIAILALSSGCVPAAAGGGTGGIVPAGLLAAPLADHHQHLFSPALAELVNGPGPLPAVEVPAELATLLREREARWNDRAALAELYVADAQLFTGSSPGWIRGRDSIAARLSRGFTGPYRMVPVAYRVEGASGSVSGYFLEGDETAERFGYFQLDLERGRGGAWRIVAETPVYHVPRAQEPITADRLVELLDAAGIRRAAVLSEAFWFDSPVFRLADPYPAVRAENDWTAQQAARYPDRLVAFCSFSPLAPHALAELERCASGGRFRGLKLSFAMSEVDLDDPGHVAQVRRVFEAANARRLAIVVHVRGGGSYGRGQAGVFLDRLASAAPDVPVQVAHLWGGEAFSAEALAAFAEAVAAGRPGTENLYFDVAETARTVAGEGEAARTVAERIRQIGVERVLYGSDAALNGRATPRQGWREFRVEIPLTDAEFAAIADNVAPYLR
ncbi:MAG TPA: amidohydrolase family protein [Longimicrobiaceae bacterium]|nr:amidohydrolase family protein [Longimicrobiaceae bacterium]